MAAAGFAGDEREQLSWRRSVIREVDAVLRGGGTPDPEALASRWMGEPHEIRAIVAVRKSLHDEGMLEESAGEAPDDAPPAAADARERDRALAGIKQQVQDAANRGDPTPAATLARVRPEIEGDLAGLAQYYDFMTEALQPEVAAGAPEPVQEVLLSHFRLVTMSARHPLGGLFLGVDQHTGGHVEVLVIRGRMSRARSSRLVKEAMLLRDVADPGFVPVVDAGEFNDVRFVAWEYRSTLSAARVIRRLRRAAGRRVLAEVLEAHSESGGRSKDPRPPSDEIAVDVPEDAAGRLLADRGHVASVLDLVASAAEALDRAHLRGLILADVRPDNVYVTQSGAARLRGLGLVQHARAAWHRLGDDVGFLAPEVLAEDDAPIDWRVDVWGVAALLYALLALDRPPDFASPEARAAMLARDLAGTPPRLVALLGAALDRDPAARPASCEILAREIRAIAATLRPAAAAGEISPPVPPWVWYGFLTVILVAVLTWILLSVL
jgi:hypothetical protein